MKRSFDLDPAVRFTAGAIGEPGDRTFFVQGRSDIESCTLLAEKEQVAVLAQALLQLLENLPEGPEGVEPREDDLDLEQPLEPEWRAGEISIGYDEEADRIAIVIREVARDDDEGAEADDEDEAEPETARFVVTRAQARAMAARALDVVAQGRPRCQFCGNPLEVEGEHVCPAMNGHRSYTED